MISFDKDFNVTLGDIFHRSEMSSVTGDLIINCGMNIILSQDDYQKYTYMIDGRLYKNKTREISVAKLVICHEMKLEYCFIYDVSYKDKNPMNCNFSNLIYSYRID